MLSRNFVISFGCFSCKCANRNKVLTRIGWKCNYTLLAPSENGRWTQLKLHILAGLTRSTFDRVALSFILKTATGMERSSVGMPKSNDNPRSLPRNEAEHAQRCPLSYVIRMYRESTPCRGGYRRGKCSLAWSRWLCTCWSLISIVRDSLRMSCERCCFDSRVCCTGFHRVKRGAWTCVSEKTFSFSYFHKMNRKLLIALKVCQCFFLKWSLAECQQRSSLVFILIHSKLSVVISSLVLKTKRRVHQ